MIDFEVLRDKGLLLLHPRAPLSADDFRRISQAVDPYIEENGRLNGLMIETPNFPGWESFNAFIEHMTFVRDHHRKIERIAVVTGSKMLKLAPRIAKHFAHPAFKVFESDDKDSAIAWLEASIPSREESDT